MKLTHIEKNFEKRALIKGGVFLLRPDDAIQFVKACKEQGIAVLGIEGFKIFGQHIQPFQEHSLDFDDVIEDSHETIIKFLEEREDTDLWFEIVSDDR